MKNFFIALIIPLLMFATTGCKVPGSVIEGIDNLSKRAEICDGQLQEVEKIARPMLAVTMKESSAQISQLDIEIKALNSVIANEADIEKKKELFEKIQELDKKKGEYEKIVKNCTKAGEYLTDLVKYLPKITRNLEQASKTLKAFNGLSDALKPEEQPERPPKEENVSETP